MAGETQTMTHKQITEPCQLTEKDKQIMRKVYEEASETLAADDGLGKELVERLKEYDGFELVAMILAALYRTCADANRVGDKQQLRVSEQGAKQFVDIITQAFPMMDACLSKDTQSTVNYVGNA